MSYLTPSEVAELLLVAPVTVRQWAQKGWLKADLTAGGHRRFHKKDVERFANDRGMTLHFHHDGGLRVLIVDDDRQLVLYLTEMLKIEDGITKVDSAYDGFEAGMKVRTFTPDIILLDLMMPGLYGFSVCRMIKTDPATRGIRIVAMSGYCTDENKQRILEAGAEICLAKPFEKQELMQAIGVGNSKNLDSKENPVEETHR